MIKLLSGILCCIILVSVHTVYAQEELPLPEGKNIKEWESISAALVSEKRYDKAIIYLDKILQEEPNNLKALSNKAGLLIKLERFVESIELSDRVLKIEPEKISTLTNKAIALKMLKEYEKSYEAFTKIIILDPENETVKKARANLLSSTPTVSTNESKFLVHVLVTIRDGNENLIGVTESTNGRFLDSKFTDIWWKLMLKENKIIDNGEFEMFQNKQIMIPEDDHTGMLTLERMMSGYNIHLFEVFVPMIELETSDTVEIQWTIIRS
tara:strand:- start:357 stop:1160 length:804 start_codon:yes stop_codon:yes gene_type:complete